MNAFTLALNTATNVFALFPVVNCWKQNQELGFVITLSSFSASCLMHLTETKHDLKPYFLANYSKTFLNLDRTLAACSFLYGIYCVRNMNFTRLQPLLLEGTIGVLALRLGEWTKNLYLYDVLHTIWHYAAFDVLNKAILFSAL